MKMTLGKSIVLLLVSILVGTAILLGGVAFFTTRASIVKLRSELLKQVDESVQFRMQAYFDRADPSIAFAEETAFGRPNFIDDWEPSARILTEFLKNERDIVWIYYADEETGAMLGCNIDQQGRYVISHVHPENDRIARGYELQEDGSFKEIELTPGNPNPYDPRGRPWYRQAAAAEGLVWTPPYGFLSSEVIGITAAKALRDREGKVSGVIGADLELKRTAAFLDEIEVGESGAAFLLLEGGASVVPSSDRNTPGVPRLQDALESRYWDFSELELGERLEVSFSHEGNDFISLVQPLDLPGRTRYYAAVVVPRLAYLDPVYRNLWLTVAIGSFVLLGAILLGVWQARRVTDPLAQISRDLDSIGNLRFQDSETEIRSNIHEVASFSDSVGKMKVSLRAFSRYVPRDLVRMLLTRGDEAKLGGNLRKITVVFTDLAGFTTFSEALTPDEAFAELNEFLELVARCQERYHGVTSSFTGDGTLALFNAPENHPTHEKDAILSALAIRDQLRLQNDERRKAGRFEFRARVGINTADVLLGNLGTKERFAYTAIGDGVNLASRLEGLSKLYGTEILVGEETRNSVREGIEWRLVDRIAVVGRRQATRIFEPLGRIGEVEEAACAGRDRYESALEAYFDGNLDSALAGFHEAASIWPQDRPSRILAQRCQRYLDEGLPEGWDGTYAATFK
ncbi:MAG: adenylate/guanylate cyclase domain-containing protein [Verrucomicrobiota bacterium]